MAELEKRLLKIDSCLQKLRTAELTILTLTQLGINNEGKQDISNKRKLIRWIQKPYEDLMEDVDKESEQWKTTLQDLLFF